MIDAEKTTIAEVIWRHAIRPGDLIEWVYESDSHQPVFEDEMHWSTPMNRWIPIGVQPAILISITDEFYFWLTFEGMYNARVDDTLKATAITGSLTVVPRVVGEPR
jgi:plastocyanin